MYGFRWERWSALAGVLFVALFAVALALSANSNDDPTELANWLADSGNRNQQFVAWLQRAVGRGQGPAGEIGAPPRHLDPAVQ